MMERLVIDGDNALRLLVISLIRAGTAASLMLCLLSGGCVAAVGAGTVALTDKTPVDHVISLLNGKDCSFVRRQRGLAYCVEDEITLPVRVHCYPTLGEVTCYAAPDPFPGGQRQLGSDQPTGDVAPSPQELRAENRSLPRMPSKTN